MKKPDEYPTCPECGNDIYIHPPTKTAACVDINCKFGHGGLRPDGSEELEGEALLDATLKAFPDARLGNPKIYFRRVT